MDNKLIAEMANKNFVGTRLSPELKQSFDEYVENSGKKPADVIREAIRSYLNFTPSTITVDIDWKTDLENRVKALEEKLEQASKDGAQLELYGSDNESDIKFDNKIENKVDITSDINTAEKQWMTTREAYEAYGEGLKYDRFRKMSVEQLREQCNLEGNLQRKNEGKGYSRPWLRKIKS